MITILDAFSLIYDLQNPDKNEQLFEAFTMFPQLQEHILSNLRWGLFFEKLPLELQQPEAFNGSTQWFKFNSAMIQCADSVIAKNCPNLSHFKFFDDSVSDYLAKISSFSVVGSDYEQFEYDVILDQNLTTVDFSKWDAKLALTIPDDSIFRTVLKSLGLKKHEYPDWMLPCMDAYFEYRCEHRRKLKIDRTYYQLGGYGSFIQANYDKSYIGQINAELGDAGSIYMLKRMEDSTPCAHLDMH